jgi:hypothetical protein
VKKMKINNNYIAIAILDDLALQPSAMNYEQP